jgi:hypothetical protein
VGNMDRIGRIGDVGDCEGEQLLLTSIGEAEQNDAGAAGGGGGERRAELPTLTGPSLPGCGSRAGA